MKIYRTKWVGRFTRRERLTDRDLVAAIARAERGLIDAELGGGLIKQRVPRSGQGRSGGYRMLVAYRSGDRTVFLYGFAKNARDNIDPDELETLREVAASMLAHGDAAIGRLIAAQELEEVKDGDNEESK